MPEFLSVLSTVFNALFIVSAITFGISLAVKTLLIQTVKKVNKESSKNFVNGILASVVKEME